MQNSPITVEDFNTLVQPMRGLPVALPWTGYGTAIFLELGKLLPLQSPRRRHAKGEYAVEIDWDWRVEKGDTILFGSSNSRPEIDVNLSSLQSAVIRSLTLSGNVPELTIDFTDGRCLKSMVMFSAPPQWNIRLPDGMYLFYDEKTLWRGEGLCHGLSPAEETMEAQADAASQRWGRPVSEPQGECWNCRSYLRLDGNFSFLDYGVCTAADSPFDGRVVNCKSGCPCFHTVADLPAEQELKNK